MKLFDTVAAVSTPPGAGGIAVIRISGEDSAYIAEKIVSPHCKKKITDFESHRLYLSEIHTADSSKVIDEALVVLFKSPRSFTGEDVVEIQCHGGFIAAKRILAEVIAAGARAAEPGEFTRRAFVNGKTDLLKAEAAADLIGSTSYLGAENAAKAVTGRLSEKIDALRRKALLFAANISAIADFPEEIEEMSIEELEERTEEIKDELEKLISGFDTGRILKEGILTVIAGRPNVGKSSVLNALLREDRAIVTDIPGTTRDIIEEYVNLGGISLRIMDTAGIRNGADEVEKIGIEKAYENIEKADLCLFTVDTFSGITPEDVEIFSRIKSRKYIIILNKTDLKKPDGELKKSICAALGADEEKIVCTFVPKGKKQDITELEEKISEMFLKENFDPSEVYITNERQRGALMRAKDAADKISFGIKSGMAQDLIYVDLEDLIFALGEITGETVQDEIIDSVFANFCVGK